MKKIENIEIKNFKSIRHAEIKDCRRINVFIGYPNTGKSNILEALSLFSIDKETKDISSITRIDSNASLFFNGNIDIPLEVSIDGVHRLFGSYIEQDDSIVIDHIFGYQNENIKRVIKSEHSFKIADKTITNYPKPAISKTTYPVEIPSVKKYEFNKALNTVSGSASSLKSPYGDNIFDVLSSNDLIRKEVREIFQQYNLKFALDKGTRTFKILKDVGDDFFLIPYSMIADTLQRVIFYKAAILSNKKTVLLFEEPEANMFPPYIRKLTSDIIFDKNDNQYFIATHSPFVINEFIEEAQNELAVYVVDYDKGETIIKRLTDLEITEVAQYGIDLFFNLESYLDKYGQSHST